MSRRRKHLAGEFSVKRPIQFGTFEKLLVTGSPALPRNSVNNSHVTFTDLACKAKGGFLKKCDLACKDEFDNLTFS